MNQDRFANALLEIKSCNSFEHDEFSDSSRMIFHHDRGADDSGCDCVGRDGCPSGIFWHAQQNRPIDQLHLSCLLIETEDGVRTESGECEIGKRQLTARLKACAHGGVLSNLVINCRWA